MAGLNVDYRSVSGEPRPRARLLALPAIACGVLGAVIGLIVSLTRINLVEGSMVYEPIRGTSIHICLLVLGFPGLAVGMVIGVMVEWAYPPTLLAAQFIVYWGVGLLIVSLYRRLRR